LALTKTVEELHLEAWPLVTADQGDSFDLNLDHIELHFLFKGKANLI